MGLSLSQSSQEPLPRRRKPRPAAQAMLQGPRAGWPPSGLEVGLEDEITGQAPKRGCFRKNHFPPDPNDF